MNVWLCAGGSKARGAEPGRGAAAISPAGPCQTQGSLANTLAFAQISLGPITLAQHDRVKNTVTGRWPDFAAGLHGCTDARSHMFLQFLDSAALAVLH